MTLILTLIATTFTKMETAETGTMMLRTTDTKSTCLVTKAKVKENIPSTTTQTSRIRRWLTC